MIVLFPKFNESSTSSGNDLTKGTGKIRVRISAYSLPLSMGHTLTSYYNRARLA